MLSPHPHIPIVLIKVADSLFVLLLAPPSRNSLVSRYTCGDVAYINKREGPSGTEDQFSTGLHICVTLYTLPFDDGENG